MTDILKHINHERVKELNDYLNEMKNRGLCQFYNKPYIPPDPALDEKIMYFPGLLLAPGRRREIVSTFFSKHESELDYYDKALNRMVICMYGSDGILLFITGKTNPDEAYIDFTRVYHDPSYVNELRDNITFARSIGHKIWSTNEIHTSEQVAARNYCRLKYNNPERKFTDLDVVEWLASFRYDGLLDKVFQAKTLEAGYKAITEPRGIGSYFGYVSIAMISILHCTDYFHDEFFCAPGKGAQKTIEYLFEDYKAKGNKINHSKLICEITEIQDKLFDLEVPIEFQNIETPYYGKFLKRDQTNYTCNAFEVGMCQFSVYRKFKENIEASKKRLVSNIDLTPFKQRELTGSYNQTNINLLNFD